MERIKVSHVVDGKTVPIPEEYWPEWNPDETAEDLADRITVEGVHALAMRQLKQDLANAARVAYKEFMNGEGKIYRQKEADRLTAEFTSGKMDAAGFAEGMRKLLK